MADFDNLIPTSFDLNKIYEPFDISKFSPQVVEVDSPMQHVWASEQFKIIKDYIEDFEKSLDKEHEVGIMMTHFGQSIVMHVTEISYKDPVLIIFKGLVNGRLSTLIQHINQLNFLLTSLEILPDTPKNKIGFAVEQ